MNRDRNCIQFTYQRWNKCASFVRRNIYYSFNQKKYISINLPQYPQSNDRGDSRYCFKTITIAVCKYRAFFRPLNENDTSFAYFWCVLFRKYHMPLRASLIAFS